MFKDYPVIYRSLWKEPGQSELTVYIAPLTKDEEAHILELDEGFYGELAAEWLELDAKLHWMLARRVNTCNECLYHRILLSLYGVLTEFLNTLVKVQHPE